MSTPAPQPPKRVKGVFGGQSASLEQKARQAGSSDSGRNSHPLEQTCPTSQSPPSVRGVQDAVQSPSPAPPTAEHVASGPHSASSAPGSGESVHGLLHSPRVLRASQWKPSSIAQSSSLSQG